MVQIYIKLENGASELNEWTIIELQGDLEIDEGKTLAEKFMADLHFGKDGNPILILGHHILYGKVCNLDKPMLLLKKHRPDLTNQTEYLIKCVIRKKLLFNKRPKPIVF